MTTKEAFKNLNEKTQMMDSNFESSQINLKWKKREKLVIGQKVRIANIENLKLKKKHIIDFKKKELLLKQQEWIHILVRTKTES